MIYLHGRGQDWLTSLLYLDQHSRWMDGHLLEWHEFIWNEL